MSKVQTKHGMVKHPAYGVWHSMKQRCEDPNHPAYKNYGGRGITVCSEWQHSFETFWKHMGPTWVKGLDLDRIDNSMGYTPVNCRWTSRLVNSRNKRTTRLPGWVLDAADKNGVGRSTLYYRLGIGVPFERAVQRKSLTS